MSQIQKPASIGIEETLDFFDLADAIVEDVQKSKEDDGKVDRRDILNFLNLPGKLISAFSGIEKIDDELTDLSDEENKILQDRINKFAKNPRYGRLVGHLLGAANEVAGLIADKKAA